MPAAAAGPPFNWPLGGRIRGSLLDCSPYLVRLRLATLSFLILDLDPIVGSEVPRPVGRGLEWVENRLFPNSGLPGFALALHGTPRLVTLRGAGRNDRPDVGCTVGMAACAPISIQGEAGFRCDGSVGRLLVVPGPGHRYSAPCRISDQPVACAENCKALI